MADFTSVRFDTLVYVGVCVEVGFTMERFVTVIMSTMVRSVPSMYSCVGNEVTLVNKGFITSGTFEWSDARVNELVSVKVLGIGKGFLTCITLVRTRFHLRTVMT